MLAWLEEGEEEDKVAIEVRGIVVEVVVAAIVIGREARVTGVRVTAATVFDIVDVVADAIDDVAETAEAIEVEEL